MRVIATAEVQRILDYVALARAIDEALRQGIELPVRHHHPFEVPGDDKAGMLLLMPAWVPGDYMVLKSVTIVPGNAARGLPAVLGSVIVFDATTGEVKGIMDAQELTGRRTAATSALAATYLAPHDASRLLVVGAGKMAPHLARAHSAVRPIAEIAIWNHPPEKDWADELAERLAAEGLNARPAADLEEAARAADVISCATLSFEPLIRGAWLRPGQHIDLVGAYSPEMRESDDDVMRRARVYLDTRDGGLKGSGDVVLALRSGALRDSDIVGDLFDLARGKARGRETADEITVFKSVGCALEDFVAARMVVENL